MKLKNLLEDDETDYILMTRWGQENIGNYHDMMVDKEIELDVLNKTFRGENISLRTKDTHLKYNIDVNDTLGFLTCINLESLEGIVKLCATSTGFYRCYSLNFNTLESILKRQNKITDIDFYFDYIDSLHSHMFSDLEYSSLYFSNCRSKTLYDFSTWLHNNKVFKLSLHATHDDILIFKNLSFLLDENVKINNINIVYKINEGFLLSEIINKYLLKTDKSEHVMDFSLEIIEADFENML